MNGMKLRDLVFGIALAFAVTLSEAAELVFVGTVPADTEARGLVKGYDATAPVHCLTWHLSLMEGGVAKASVKYGLPGKDDPNQLVDGPTIQMEAKWVRLRGRMSNSDATIYKLIGASEESALYLVAVGENLLHFVTKDGALKIGNGGWSYTLSKKGVGAEK